MKSTNDEQEAKSSNTMGSVLAGLLLGGLAGAGAALLLAPQSGKQTRAQIEQKTIELRDLTAQSVDEAVAQVKSKAQEISTEVREKAEELEQTSRQLLAKQLDRVSSAAEAGKTALASGTQGQ